MLALLPHPRLAHQPLDLPPPPSPIQAHPRRRQPRLNRDRLRIRDRLCSECGTADLGERGDPSQTPLPSPLARDRRTSRGLQPLWRRSTSGWLSVAVMPGSAQQATRHGRARRRAQRRARRRGAHVSKAVLLAAVGGEAGRRQERHGGVPPALGQQPPILLRHRRPFCFVGVEKARRHLRKVSGE